ncbi:hypothetical protein OAD45_00145 [Gammaproteobacteria bacterium]|nr:hypothetical protein [Gammaproteobacteria bacterium]
MPWLHVIRDHPIYNENYNDYYQNKTLYIVALNALFQLVKNFSLSIFFLFKRFLVLQYFPQESSFNNVDTIFLSHAVNSKNFSDSKDFYFGDVPTEHSRDKQVEILYFNWTDEKEFTIQNDEIKRTILNERLGLIQEIKFFGIAGKGLVNLFYLLIKGKLRFKFFFYVLPHIFSTQTLNNTRRYFQFLQFLADRQPSKIICTFEGHAHEKLFFLAAKKTNPRILTFAYQHSTLFKNQYSVFEHYLPECKPDYILASGELSAERLKASYPDSKFIVVGSHKCGENIIANNQPEKVSMLFVPEGFECESLKMLSFAQNCARLFPGNNFIFRLHPMVENNELIAHQLNASKFPNLTFSKNSINDDILMCQFVIYRGSSAVLDAAINQLIPIFLDDPKDSCELDVLYMIEKKKITSPEDLSDLMNIDTDNLVLLRKKHNHLFDFIQLLRGRIKSKDFGLKNL